MKISENAFRRMIREESKRIISEGYGSAVLGATGATGAAAAAAYRGYKNVSGRSAGMQNKITTADDPEALQLLERDVRAVFYGAGSATAFFNMTQDAGMFNKDLLFGEGGDFEDITEEAKEDIVKRTFERVKNGTLTAKDFHTMISAKFAQAGENPPQQAPTTSTLGTDTYFAMLDTIQQNYKQQNPAAPGAAAGGAGGAAAKAAPVAGAPTAAAGVKAAGGAKVNVEAIKAFQRLVNTPDDGVWSTKTNAAFTSAISGAKIEGASADQLGQNWATYSGKITKLNGVPVIPGTYTPNIAGATKFVNDAKKSLIANTKITPFVATEGISESRSRINIIWGR